MRGDRDEDTDEVADTYPQLLDGLAAPAERTQYS